MTTIAEGVETPTQMDALRQYGCDQVQGYRIARPFPEDDLPAYLETHAASRELLRPHPRPSVRPEVCRRKRSA